MMPGTAQALITIGPEAAIVAGVFALALVWIGRGVAEEIRRTAARGWEPRVVTPAATPTRLAA
jgi:hypothetical protein